MSHLPPDNKINKFRKALLSWYSNNGRSFPWRAKSATVYERIISEILLQRTQATTVDSFYPKFIKKYPSWNVLALASETELQEWFKPIGLWRRKASSIKMLAREMHLRNGEFPRGRNDIQALPGIGQYICNAVLIFGFEESQPLLDANMARVLERYFGPRKLVDIRYDPYLQNLAKKVVAGRDTVSINWAILDIASLLCKQRAPLCHDCPLLDGCKYPREFGLENPHSHNSDNQTYF